MGKSKDTMVLRLLIVTFATFMIPSISLAVDSVRSEQGLSTVMGSGSRSPESSVMGGGRSSVVTDSVMGAQGLSSVMGGGARSSESSVMGGGASTIVFEYGSSYHSGIGIGDVVLTPLGEVRTVVSEHEYGVTLNDGLPFTRGLLRKRVGLMAGYYKSGQFFRDGRGQVHRVEMVFEGGFLLTDTGYILTLEQAKLYQFEIEASQCARIFLRD